MPSRDISQLKKLIYQTLTSDNDLVNLLGGKEKIKHANPLAVSDYPCITYTVLSEEGEPYNEDFYVGISTSIIEIQVFSNNSSVSEADAIESRIYELFTGNTSLSNEEVKIFSIKRESRQTLFESDIKIHRIVSNYKIVNAL